MNNSEWLRFAIGPDMRAEIQFTGPVTREAVGKLISILECGRETFPTDAEVQGRRQSALDSLARTALGTEAGQRPCVHCSYTGGRKYKMCDACLAAWLEANGYDMSGRRVA